MEETNIKPLNDYILVKIEDDEKSGVYLGENKDKPKIGKILAFSDECKNKNLEIGKHIYINKYDLIPCEEYNTYFVSEKALIAKF